MERNLTMERFSRPTASGWGTRAQKITGTQNTSNSFSNWDMYTNENSYRTVLKNSDIENIEIGDHLLIRTDINNNMSKFELYTIQGNLISGFKSENPLPDWYKQVEIIVVTVSNITKIENKKSQLTFLVKRII